MSGFPAMASGPADRNLLFGILALQIDFIDRDALVVAMNAWVLDKTKPLGQIFVEQGKLTAERLHLLEALVAEHLRVHGDDPQKSLSALSSVSPVRKDLHQIQDADLQHSLSLAGSAQLFDPEATRSDVLRTAEGAPAVVRYRVLRPHAKGGIGEIFIAEDEELHREVALKEIQERHAQDTISRNRFLLEAEITGELEHPGIVPVYGLGKYSDGRPFYAMRFIRGDNLREAIRHFHEADVPDRDQGERSLSLRQLLRRFLDVCNAIAYAHSRGVLHRDLKPGNIMLGKYGETLIIDWGLAKPAGRLDPIGTDESTFQPSAGTEFTGTLIGSPIGTPAYMSPEQAAGRLDHLGPASDIYGLGATLYAVLTGRAPFVEEEANIVLEKVQRGDLAPPRRVKPAVAPALEAICLKAMALRPNARYVSPRALAEDLEHWLADEPVTVYRETLPARLGRWGRRHRTLAASAAVFLACAVVALSVGIIAVKREQEQTQLALVRESEALEKESQARRQTRQALDEMSSEVIDEWLGKQQQLEPGHVEFLKKALNHYEVFAQQSAETEEARAGLAGAFARTGNIRATLGLSTEAETAYQEAITIYDQLASDHPEWPDYRHQLGKSHTKLGQLLTHLGRRKEAELAFGNALPVQKHLVADFPDNREYRAALGVSQDKLGVLLILETGRFQEAQASFGEALAVRKQLCADFPTEPDFRKELAGTLSNLGLMFDETGRHEEAKTRFQDAIAVQKQLVADFPTRAEYREYLGKHYFNLGSVLQRMGQTKQAEAAYGDSLTHFKQLGNDFPTRPDYRDELALATRKLGGLLSETSRHKEAEIAYRDSISMQKQLVTEFPSRPQYRRNLAATYGNFALLLQDRNLLLEAERYQSEALKLCRQLAGNSHAPAEDNNALAGTLVNLATLAMAQGKAAEACQWIAEAVPFHTAALKDNPRNSAYRQFLRNNRLVLAKARLALCDPNAAAEAAEEMVNIGYDPANDAYYAASMLTRCASLAETVAKLPENKRHELARNYADRAMAYLRRAIEDGYTGHVEKDKDLDVLQRREDFKKLIAEQSQPKIRIAALEARLHRESPRFDYLLHNELRHLYADVDEKKSLHHCDVIFSNATMDSYTLGCLGGGSAADAKAKKEAAMKLLRWPEKYPEYRFVAAACWLKAAELLSDDRAKKNELLEKVTTMKGDDLGSYRAAAEAELHK
jgi:serine/threonine-protein kinase